jgi:hypothetical protein
MRALETVDSLNGRLVVVCDFEVGPRTHTMSTYVALLNSLHITTTKSTQLEIPDHSRLVIRASRRETRI